MPNVSVQFSHVLLFTVASFLLSWFWYSRFAFAKPWCLALKRDPERGGKDMSPEERRRMPLLLLAALLSSFLKILVLAAAVAGLNARTAASGAVVGVLAWLGFTLSSSLDTLWEGRPS
ncbi:MAG: DUF1761 domain-containing protein, partial [bacterium]